MSKPNVILPQLTDDEVEKLYTYFTKFDKNYSKFKGSKREYIVYVIGIVQSKKKTKKMEGGAPKAKPAGKAAAAASPEAIRAELRRLSTMAPQKLFTLIEDTVDKLDKMMEKLVDAGVNADETLTKMRKELSDIPEGEEHTAREKEIEPVEIAARIRESGRVGEEKALEVLNKYKTIFSEVKRLPQPAAGIEPILDLVAISKTGGQPTLIEVKNRVHGAPDVGIQQTKIMAALYLMSDANKTYQKKLPIVVFIRGNPSAPNRRDQQDRAETFDLVKVLKSIGVDKTKLTPAELTEYRQMINATDGVNMVVSQQQKWKDKTKDILPKLESSGYGEVTDKGPGFKTFTFDIKPDSILVESGEMAPIYTQTYRAPVVKTAAEEKAEGRQKALDEIESNLSKLTDYVPGAKSIMINAAKKNKIEREFKMSEAEYKELYNREYEKKRLAKEREVAAANTAKKREKAVALTAEEKAREEAEQKELDEAAAAAALARPAASSINTMSPELKTEFAKKAASNLITRIEGHKISNRKKWNEEQPLLKKMEEVVKKVDEGVILRDIDIGTVLMYYYNRFPTDFSKFVFDNNIAHTGPYIDNAVEQFKKNEIQTAAHAALANELADNYMKLDLDLGLGYTEYANEMLKKGTIMSPEMHTISVKKKEIFDKLEGTTDPKQKGLLKMGMKLLPILEDRLIEKDKHFVPMFIEQLKDTRTDIEYNKLLSDIIKLSHTIALRKLPKDQWIDQSNPGLFKKYEEIIEIPMYVGLNYPTGTDSQIKIKNLRDHVSDEAEKLLPYLMDLGNPDTKNILNKKLKKIKSEVHEVFPEYKVPEAEDESIEKLEKRLEFNRRRQELSDRAEAAAQEEKDPEIQKELLIISENLLNDDTTEAQYEEDFALFNKLTKPKKKTGEGMFGSGKKMLCRFSSGLGIY